MIKAYYKSPDHTFNLLHGDTFELLPQFNFKFDMIFADPPYFLSSGGISVQSGKVVCVDKGDWDKSMSQEDINAFNLKWLSLCREKLKDNGTIWISGTYHNIFSVANSLTQLGYKILNVITWAKTNPPPNISCRYFTYSTEFIIWARKSQKVPHYYNYELMKQLNGGTQMTDMWTIPAVSSWEKKQGKHPTQKPLRLLYRIILASTSEGDTILDPFSGSGTTGIAANLLGRKFIGIEKDVAFCELAHQRREALEDPVERQRLYDKMRENPQEITVLVNHMRPMDRQLAMQLGITYLRAGDSKGSLLVRPGFERLGYLCLHTDGDAPKLFKLTKSGFQIWTADALHAKGFTAENAPYYAVLRFDASTPIPYDQPIDLHQHRFTTVAQIRPLSDFIGIK